MRHYTVAHVTIDGKVREEEVCQGLTKAVIAAYEKHVASGQQIFLEGEEMGTDPEIIQIGWKH